MEILQVLFYTAMAVVVYFIAEICKILGRIEGQLDEILKKLEKSN